MFNLERSDLQEMAACGRKSRKLLSLMSLKGRMATVIADLSPGTSVIFKVDMASYCLMTKPGLYRITATLRLSNVREFDTLKKLPQPMHILDLTLTSNVLELKRSEQGLLDVEVGAGLSNK